MRSDSPHRVSGYYIDHLDEGFSLPFSEELYLSSLHSSPDVNIETRPYTQLDEVHV